MEYKHPIEDQSDLSDGKFGKDCPKQNTSSLSSLGYKHINLEKNQNAILPAKIKKYPVR